MIKSQNELPGNDVKSAAVSTIARYSDKPKLIIIIILTIVTSISSLSKTVIVAYKLTPQLPHFASG